RCCLSFRLKPKSATWSIQACSDSWRYALIAGSSVTGTRTSTRKSPSRARPHGEIDGTPPSGTCEGRCVRSSTPLTAAEKPSTFPGLNVEGAVFSRRDQTLRDGRLSFQFEGLATDRDDRGRPRRRQDLGREE